MEEVWKDISGYEGLYSISNFGNVQSLRFNPPKLIYQSKTNAGYKQVRLYKNGKVKQFGVHRLVAMMFVEGYQNGLEVNHKDLNKTNNVYTNLEWTTRKYNQKHQYLAYHPNYIQNTCLICGKLISKNSSYCLKHREEKRKNEKWPKIDELKEDLKFLSFLQIGKKYGYSDNNIRKICRSYGLPTNRNEVKEYRKQFVISKD